MGSLPSLRDPPRLPDVAHIGTHPWPPLPRDFYARPVLELARALLGCVLISDDGSGAGHLTAGTIVETEAYAGPEDRASHARAGLTRRTAPMFGEPGHAYVYLVYGMHNCLNVVGDRPGNAGAVLLRAIEPLAGLGLMRARRGSGPDACLGAGPARLCRALGVTRQLDGHDLVAGARLWLAAPPLAAPPPATPLPDVLTGPRIGVAYAGEWADRPWRFGVSGSPSLSRPFPGATR